MAARRKRAARGGAARRGGSSAAVPVALAIAGLAAIALVLALGRDPGGDAGAGEPAAGAPAARPGAPAASAAAADRRTAEPAPREPASRPPAPAPAGVSAAPVTTAVAVPQPHGPAGEAPARRPAHALAEDDPTPRVAIVLDDCGQRLDLMERAVRSRSPLTFAVIPHLPHSRASAELAFGAGHEVIVHQPMEPEGGDEDPGQGVLRVGMKPRAVAATLRESFAQVPHAVGLNNHMGSRATADPELMGAVLAGLRAIDPELYFLDSRTSARTVGRATAARQGVRSAERAVFLDNDLSQAAIRGELDRLLRTAAERGEAIGIGHLKPETLDVLEAVLPATAPDEVRFVFLSDLVR